VVEILLHAGHAVLVDVDRGEVPLALDRLAEWCEVVLVGLLCAASSVSSSWASSGRTAHRRAAEQGTLLAFGRNQGVPH
jgi:hypothetical protein